MTCLPKSKFKKKFGWLELDSIYWGADLSRDVNFIEYPHGTLQALAQKGERGEAEKKTSPSNRRPRKSVRRRRYA